MPIRESLDCVGEIFGMDMMLEVLLIRFQMEIRNMLLDIEGKADPCYKWQRT